MSTGSQEPSSFFLIPVSTVPQYVAYYIYAELLKNVCSLYAKSVSHMGPFFPNGGKREESFFFQKKI